MQTPKATKKNQKLVKHNDVRVDPYYWMKNRTSKTVLKYLDDENKYVHKKTKPLTKLKKELFKEMKGRFVKDDSSLPVKLEGYYYYTRYKKNSEYPLYCRKKGSLKAKEEIYLDVNKMAKGHNFYQLTSVSICPNHNMVAFAVDIHGRRIYDIHFKDLKTKKILKQTIKSTSANFVWANDNETLFYSDISKTLRSEKIYRYNLKSKKSQLIFHEKDEAFSTYVSKSSTKKYIYIGSSSTMSSETQYLDADKPFGKFKLFQKRKKDHKYSVGDGEDRFYIVSNFKGKNGCVATTEKSKTNQKHWKVLVPHHKDIFIEGLSVFKDFFALETRQKGLCDIFIFSRTSKKVDKIKFKDPAYTAYVGGNPHYDTKKLRYVYESLNTPSSLYDYDVKTKKSSLKKQQKVLGKFNSKNYVVERVWFKGKDKTSVPMSIVYKKGLKKNGKNPTLLYGYGSYGLNVDPYFSATRLSLLDRGFVFAIAHIRGSSTLGYHWYEKGKKLKKKNTFLDFISAGKFLISKKYTSSQHLYAMGGSAGGLLMGAVMNMAPQLFNGVISVVPFVDVVTTMLDDSIPLTTIEYDEWGNPNNKTYYKYMKSYSPYDNIENKTYPHLLVRTGFHDSQVQYWEPAKWVAKLRDQKKNKNLILFLTDMEAGHSGTTGRFKSLEEMALDYAFLIGLENQQLATN